MGGPLGLDKFQLQVQNGTVSPDEQIMFILWDILFLCNGTTVSKKQNEHILLDLLYHHNGYKRFSFILWKKIDLV